MLLLLHTHPEGRVARVAEAAPAPAPLRPVGPVEVPALRVFFWGLDFCQEASGSIGRARMCVCARRGGLDGQAGRHALFGTDLGDELVVLAVGHLEGPGLERLVRVCISRQFGQVSCVAGRVSQRPASILPNQTTALSLSPTLTSMLLAPYSLSHPKDGNPSGLPSVTAPPSMRVHSGAG